MSISGNQPRFLIYNRSTSKPILLSKPFISMYFEAYGFINRNRLKTINLFNPLRTTYKKSSFWVRFFLQPLRSAYFFITNSTIWNKYNKAILSEWIRYNLLDLNTSKQVFTNSIILNNSLNYIS